MRRRLTVLATAALLVVATTLPAWAQPAFIDGEVDPDVDVLLTMRVPSQPDAGDTVAVRLLVPAAFTYLGCSTSPLSGWSCAETVVSSGTVVDYTAGPTGAAPADLTPFSVNVHTPDQPGSHSFNTTQTYRDGSSTSFTAAAGTAPVVTVVDPEPADDGSEGPDGSGSEGPDGSGSESPDGSGSESPDGSGSEQPGPAPEPAPPASGSGGSGDSGSGTSGAGGTTSGGSSGGTAATGGSRGGSTAPTRTGTSRGSSFDVTTTTPMETTEDGAAAPDVAPQVADALASNQAAGETVDVADDVAEGAANEGGGPQRAAGVALLVAGAVGVAVRQQMHARR